MESLLLVRIDTIRYDTIRCLIAAVLCSLPSIILQFENAVRPYYYYVSDGEPDIQTAYRNKSPCLTSHVSRRPVGARRTYIHACVGGCCMLCCCAVVLLCVSALAGLVLHRPGVVVRYWQLTSCRGVPPTPARKTCVIALCTVLPF